MTNMKLFISITIVACLLIPAGTVRAEDVQQSAAPSEKPVAVESEQAVSNDAPLDKEIHGTIRVMPRYYDFSGDQGYLQRYRALDAGNANWLDEALAVVNELAVDFRGPKAGAPRLQLVHSNPFILNDQWALRYRPGDSVRLDLNWHDYQRPLEVFLPASVPGSVSYAQRYNNDMIPGKDLFRRREDLELSASFDPAVWSEAAAFVREAGIRYGHFNRRGNRQFSWIFGVVEDLVVPAGNNPDRWRGRTEEIDQDIDRYSAHFTFVLGRGNATRVRLFGERFRNDAPLITNADIARLVPAINTQPRTIDYIADHSVSGGEITIEQRLSDRLLLVADAFMENLELDSLAPLQAQSVYDAEIQSTAFGAGLFYDATENLVVEATSRWTNRKNDTPVGTSLTEPRTYLMQDRNLSTPFLEELSTATYGATATFHAKRFTARFGARQEDSERELIQGAGSNAIPQELSIYRTDSNPTTIWTSVSGRSSKKLNWSARYEYRRAGDTWTISDPETAHRFRGTASMTSGSGAFGGTTSLSWENQANDQFVFRSDLGSAPQKFEMEALNVALSGWYVASPRLQLHAGVQRLDREQEGNLVVTDVRRWRDRVVPALIDDEFGYDSTVDVFDVGATLSIGERLTLFPSILWVASEGGIDSAVAPVREFTLINNDARTLAIASDYRLSPRSAFSLRYALSEYDDASPSDLSGRIHELSAGVTFSF